jgi:hypothetical protein
MLLLQLHLTVLHVAQLLAPCDCGRRAIRGSDDGDDDDHSDNHGDSSHHDTAVTIEEGIVTDKRGQGEEVAAAVGRSAGSGSGERTVRLAASTGAAAAVGDALPQRRGAALAGSGVAGSAPRSD